MALPSGVVLTEYFEQGNLKKYQEGAHTVLLPKTVAVYRSPAEGTKTTRSYRLVAQHGAVDAITGDKLPSPITVEVKYTAPVLAAEAAVTATITTAIEAAGCVPYNDAFKKGLWPVFP